MPGSQAQSTGRADREAATKHWNWCVIGAKKIQPVRKDTFGTNRMRKQSVRQGDATFQGCV